MPKKPKAVDLVFVGGGYVIGVPARDLSAEEFGALSDEQRESVLQSGLYVEADDAPASDDEDENEEGA